MAALKVANLRVLRPSDYAIQDAPRPVPESIRKRPAFRKYTDEQAAKANELLALGWSRKQIADATGLTTDQVKRFAQGAAGTSAVPIARRCPKCGGKCLVWPCVLCRARPADGP